jgi:hypothetical protein
MENLLSKFYHYALENMVETAYIIFETGED